MTKKPTYATMNPRVMLITDGIELSKPIRFNMFNDDGTEADPPSTSNAELAVIVKAMLNTLPENFEMRLLLKVLESMNRLAENAAMFTLQQMFILVHDEEIVGHLDHDLMCSAVQNYFDENEVEPTPECDGASMLDKLLTTGRKPH